MAIAIDASSPPVVTQTANTTTTITTASFTPPANSLVVALTSAAYFAITGSLIYSISDSLSGTWTTSAQQLRTSSTFSSVAVFTRFVTSSAAMTVTLTTDTDEKGKQLVVLVLTGTASTSWTGATVVSTTTMDASVTTTTAGSWVVASTAYELNATLAADANTTIVNHLTDTTDQGELFACRSTSATGTPGAITIGVTGASTGGKTYAAVEILPVAGGTNYTANPADSMSANDRLPPVPPDGLTATVVSSTEIDLAWSMVADAVGYDVERDSAVISTGQTGRTLADTGLTASTTYNYNVRSVY